MRYLVTSNINEPFFTDWFQPENHWRDDCLMVIYDLQDGVYTDDGRNWWPIEKDSL